MTSPLNNLSLLRPGIRTRRVSSYDRSGGGNGFVRVDAGEIKTLARSLTMRMGRRAAPGQ